MAEQGHQAWTVRGGAEGQCEPDSLERGIVLLGFNDIPDLSPAADREAIRELVRFGRPNHNEHHRNNVSSQLFAFKCRMATGDVVAMPLKSIPGFVAVGRVRSKYQRIEIDGEMRHARQAEWRESHVERSKIAPDLLASIDARQTVSQPRAENSNQRLAEIYAHGVDPLIAANAADPDDVNSYIVAQDPEEEILEHLRTQFPGHEMERLVAAILEAEGYVTLQTPPARPDQGVDVLAGHGPMGFDPPRICVQVKNTVSPIDAPTVQQLHGAMTTFSADQSLFVSWSGYTSAAESEARRDFFTMWLWKARDVLDAVCRNYDKLPSDIRAEIPLKQVWTLVQDDDL